MSLSGWCCKAWLSEVACSAVPGVRVGRSNSQSCLAILEFDPTGWWLSVDHMLNDHEPPSPAGPHHKLSASLGNWGPSSEKGAGQTVIPLPPSCEGGTGHAAVFYRETQISLQPLGVSMAPSLQALRLAEVPRVVGVVHRSRTDTMCYY